MVPGKVCSNIGIAHAIVRAVNASLAGRPVVRFGTAPGEQTQVDWVEFRKGKNPLYAFCATLGRSRVSFVEFVTDMKNVLLGAICKPWTVQWLKGIAGHQDFGGSTLVHLFNYEIYMHKVISLHEKQVNVELTRAAQNAINVLNSPLVAEIHLIFGCLIVKRVWFKETSQEDDVLILGNLSTRFRTVRYAKHCRFSHIDSGEEQPMDYPLVADKKAFVPHWLRIDFHRGRWVGRYGYDRSATLEIVNSRQNLADEGMSVNKLLQGFSAWKFK